VEGIVPWSPKYFISKGGITIECEHGDVIETQTIILDLRDMHNNMHTWAWEGGAGIQRHPGFWNFQKKVVFVVSSGKNKISPLLAPYSPPGKKSFRRPRMHITQSLSP